MKCRADGCGEEIIFTLTKNGKQMPTNLSSLTEEDVEWLLNRDKDDYGKLLPYRHGEHVSHYATCTDPEQFRKQFYGNFGK